MILVLYVRGRPRGDEGLFFGEKRDVGDVESASLVLTAVEAEGAEPGMTSSGGGNLVGAMADMEERAAALASTPESSKGGSRC